MQEKAFQLVKVSAFLVNYKKITGVKKLKVKILLVDDRKENLFSLGSLLEDLDVEIFKAQSGSDALELMVDHDFALALLDVQMPDMDGFELAELMRGAERTKSVPIIFITAASKTSGFAFRGYESGAVDFLYKPVDPIFLKSKVRVFIELGAQRRQLKEQMELLTAAKESAETANRLKSAFLANMSHEIRTPLGALIGFTELLEDNNVSNQEKNDYVKIIGRSGKALVRLIDDILDLSKVEAGHLELEAIRFSPAALTQEVFDLLGKLATQKGLQLHLKSNLKPNMTIVSDPTRLRQVLVNIIGNAIKFTEKGSVTVTLDQTLEKSPDASFITFSVEDTGIGLSNEQAHRLFQPFMQADNSMTRRFGGTGLGLVLSRRLASLMGGDVKLVRSEANKGSNFLISIKAKLAEDNQNSEAPRHLAGSESSSNQQMPSLEGIKVLLVEDSPDNQLLIKRFLVKQGADVSFANNGEEGVDKALASDYDVVLMDIQMPILDGYAAATKLRKKNYLGPIIAITAHATEEERNRCLSAGCTDYLAKPIDRTQLYQKVAKHSGAPQTADV